MIKKYEVKFPLKILYKSLFANQKDKDNLIKILKKKLNKKIILTSSGSSAIYIALKDIEKKNGKGYVITPNYSCKAIPRAIIKAGFKPIFVDIDNKLSVDKKLLIKAIIENRDKIKAIIAWHPEGFVFNNNIIKIAKKFKIPLIEDCASSLALVNGKLVGNIGNYSILSFRIGKLIHGGGGALISKEPIKINLKKKNSLLVFIGFVDLVLRNIYNLEKPKAIIDHFFDKVDKIDISNKEASLVYYQMNKLDENRKKRNYNYDRIMKIKKLNILDLSKRKVLPIPTSIIIFEKEREKFIKFMKKKGIKISKDHDHVNSDFFEGKIYGDKISREISRKITHIPVHEHLKEEDLYKIMEALKKWTYLNYPK